MCDTGYTNIKSSCYKCSDPYAIPTFDDNINKVVCNSKPVYFYGPTYSEESNIWSVTPFTGQLQCNNNSEIKMIDNGGILSPWTYDNKEPICQNVLPSIIDIKYRGSDYTICGTNIPISKELCGKEPSAGLDVSNEKSLDSDNKVKCGMDMLVSVEFDNPIESIVPPRDIGNATIDIKSNIATISIKNSRNGRCTSTEVSDISVPFAVDGQKLMHSFDIPENE